MKIIIGIVFVVAFLTPLAAEDCPTNNGNEWIYCKYGCCDDRTSDTLQKRCCLPWPARMIFLTYGGVICIIMIVLGCVYCWLHDTCARVEQSHTEVSTVHLRPEVTNRARRSQPQGRVRRQDHRDPVQPPGVVPQAPPPYPRDTPSAPPPYPCDAPAAPPSYRGHTPSAPPPYTSRCEIRSPESIPSVLGTISEQQPGENSETAKGQFPQISRGSRAFQNSRQDNNEASGQFPQMSRGSRAFRHSRQDNHEADGQFPQISHI